MSDADLVAVLRGHLCSRGIATTIAVVAAALRPGGTEFEAERPNRDGRTWGEESLMREAAYDALAGWVPQLDPRRRPRATLETSPAELEAGNVELDSGAS